MKVTIKDNVKQYVLYKINKVYIGFDDNTEVKLSHIVEYDIDLDNVDISTIGFKNALFDVEVENHFKGNKRNHIIYIHIEAMGVDLIGSSQFNVFYDIPCEMKIRRFVTDGCDRELGYMFVELEGYIK